MTPAQFGVGIPLPIPSMRLVYIYLHERKIYQSHGWYGLLFTSFHHHLDSVGRIILGRGLLSLIFFGIFHHHHLCVLPNPSGLSTRWKFATRRTAIQGFLQWWHPATMGFPAKNHHFGVFLGVATIKETPIYTLR